ncbi:MAG TPA: plasmid mobilization relaxosome protein MobC [Clostridia bacterium]|nr:plasmid mobilization relaxosome protein MobC [Clostridia bacterium]
MQIRDIKKQIWMNKTEALSLARKAKRAGLTEAALMRLLVSGYEPKEKPDDRFYDVMRQLSAIGNSMSQIARKANALGFIDAREYKCQAELLQQFQLEVRRYFILPDKVL